MNGLPLEAADITHMANIIFAERENASLHAPALKMRQRLQSAPENLLKTPLTAKKFHTPLQSGRKALGAVNKITSTPAINGQEKKHQKTQNKAEEYPDIERLIPYDPLEFEKTSIPEDLVHLSCLALPGLTCYPQTPCLPEEDFALLESYTPPLKMQRSDYCAAELDAFLQTINELTIDLPPELE
ncbi:securin isoform 2-T2 [Polymixia lowei]